MHPVSNHIKGTKKILGLHTVQIPIVRSPIKKPSYFHLSDESSLNLEMSLNYKNPKLKTFVKIFCFVYFDFLYRGICS